MHTVKTYNYWRDKVQEGVHCFTSLSFTFLILILLLRFFETIYTGLLHGFPGLLLKLVGFSLLSDLLFWFKSSIWLLVLFLPVYLLNKKIATTVYIILVSTLCIIHVSLIQYFNNAMVPLGADLYGYSLNDIKQTVGAGGNIKTSVILFLAVIAILVLIFYWLPKKIGSNKISAASFMALCILAFFFTPASIATASGLGSEFVNNEAINKSDFFFSKSYQHFFPEETEIDIYADSYIGDYGDGSSTRASFTYVDETNYPFLHIDSTADVLTPFLTKGETPPNIVIVLAEGLGRAFSNEGAYLGSFTPFIDSLSKQSLYWENFLSTGGRTFAVLPSVLGSLPFGKNGFMELGEKMPQHISLISLLKLNGYRTSFFYGGESNFDNMNVFLKKNNIDELHDKKAFPAGYSVMPSQNGFSWGYGDKDLFRRFLEVKKDEINSPHLSVVLTVSTHSPFLINEQDLYFTRFEHRMNTLGFDEKKKSDYRKYRQQYASILYLDDALQSFFSNYSKRNDFRNTIFIVTGDHRMPEIPMSSKIDRYHVPFIVYSPLLKRTAKFASVSSHFDVAPSLVAFLKNNYNIKAPSLVSWLGSGLDTSRGLQNIHSFPLMQTKNDLVDFTAGNNLLNGNGLYLLGQNMAATSITDERTFGQLKASFDQFINKNNKIINGASLIPDSIYQRYTVR